MANFAININAFTNLPPDQLGIFTLILDHNEVYTFSLSNFTSETIPPYNDPEGDDAETIKIITIPATGVLALNAVPVIAGDDISRTDIINNLLVYTADAGTLTAYDEVFTFNVADQGSLSFSATSGTVAVNVSASVNQPPSVVGDGDETIDYGETLVFTRAMFTTSTTPPYADPEGDAALDLKITQLPFEGVIQLNGVPIVVNTVVPFASIDAGLLTYVPALIDTDGDLESFTFEIADAGSGQFVG